MFQDKNNAHSYTFRECTHYSAKIYISPCTMDTSRYPIYITLLYSLRFTRESIQLSLMSLYGLRTTDIINRDIDYKLIRYWM